MKIDLGKIAGKTGEKTGFSFTVSPGSLGFADAELRIFTDVVVNGSVTNEQEVYIADGSISFSAECICSRCLEQYHRNFCFTFSEQFSYESEEAGFKIRDNEADLSAAVLENIFTNIPAKFLCSDSCKGLCQQCGANLNERICECADKKINPQFAKLAELLK